MLFIEGVTSQPQPHLVLGSHFALPSVLASSAHHSEYFIYNGQCAGNGLPSSCMC